MLKIEKAGISGIPVAAIHGWINAETQAVAGIIEGLKKADEMVRQENILLHRKALNLIQQKISGLLGEFHKRTR